MVSENLKSTYKSQFVKKPWNNDKVVGKQTGHDTHILTKGIDIKIQNFHTPDYMLSASKANMKEVAENLAKSHLGESIKNSRKQKNKNDPFDVVPFLPKSTTPVRNMHKHQ